MSSERQYNDIENKIIEAANGSNYPFDEASWKKMELLLDKRKDKRRPFFWLFTALVLGILTLGGAHVYKTYTYKNSLPVYKKNAGNTTNNQLLQKIVNSHTNHLPNEQLALLQKNSSVNNIDEGTFNNTTATGLIADSDTSIGKLKNQRKKNPESNTSNKLLVSGRQNTQVKKSEEKKYIDNETYDAGKKISYKTNSKVAMHIIVPDLTTDEDIVKNIPDINTETNGPGKAKPNVTVDTAGTVVIIMAKTNKQDSVGTQKTTDKKTDPKKDKKKSVSAGLYVSGSLGAEINSTKLFSFKNSKIIPRYGFAAGYQVNRRLSVQAGFYAGSKKYSAGPNDYTVKPGSYLSTVKIIEVDADCRVYEIPVTFQYNWLLKPATNYYVAVGLSGYLMKKEKYNYTFENYGTLYTYPYTYTKNSHLLASVNFSVGVEKKIGRKLYLQLAPVINVPLNGVGDGKVKLFTTSLNMGIKYFLFKK